MLRISKLTDYATVVLACLADAPDEHHSAAEVAGRTGVAAPTVSKLLKELHKSGLVRSTRGARGGYALARPAASISAAEIIDAVEGPVSLTECSGHPGLCEIEGSCRVGGAWQRVNDAIRRALGEVKLTHLTGADQQMRAPNLLSHLEVPVVWRGRV